MGIYIKDMDMPTSCADCRFAIDSLCYACLPERKAERKRMVANYCPLVEVPPHGRLIDADAIEMNYRDIRLNDGMKIYTQRAINSAPTIIPASEEGE